MIVIILAILLGVLLAGVLFVVITTTGAPEPVPSQGLHGFTGRPHDLEELKSRYEQITGDGYEPIWNDHFGWMAGQHFTAALHQQENRPCP